MISDFLVIGGGIGISIARELVLLKIELEV